jgi:hypothetical protein
MAEAKNDSSTDIETKVKAFAKDMTAEAAKIREARLKAKSNGADASAKKGKKGKKDADPPVVTFSMSGNKVSKSRTPAEQAKEVSSGKSYVCWSSHMADKARHVLMKVDGKASWDAKAAFGDDFSDFKKKWGEVMKKHSLKNAAGKDGWPSWDEFHLELDNSKMKRTHERAKACLDEYAKLTRKDGKSKNKKFEEKYSKNLKAYIEKYEKEAPKKEAAK